MPPKSRKRVGVGAAAERPMDTLYFQHYDEHVAKSGPRTAILMQVGKFFEMYDSVDVASGKSRANVQTLAEVCGSTVEPKPTSEPGRQRLFWGFPEISLPKFERLLVAAGYTVVVIIQNKDGTGAVTSRTIDHVSSPGTFWDAEGGLAIRREEQCLLSVYVEPFEDLGRRRTHWCIASTAFDVMTGRLVSTESVLALIDGKPVLDTIQPFWSMYPPAEAIIFWCSSAPCPPESSWASFFQGTRRPLIHVRTLDPKQETPAPADRVRMDYLATIFKHSAAIGIAEALDISYYHAVRRSLTHLLMFVKDHNPSYLANLHNHTIWTPDTNCVLGNAALEQLAMLPLYADKPHECLLHWIQKTHTVMGKRTLRERCLKPLADVEVLEERQARIAELRTAPWRSTLESQIKGCVDLPRVYRRFQLGRGSTDDLLTLLITYEKIESILSTIKGTCLEPEESEELLAHVQGLRARWDVERIRAARQLVSDAIAVGAVHPWRRGIHPALDAHEDSWTALQSSQLAKLTKWHEILEEDDVIAWALKEDAPFTFTTNLRRAQSLAAVSKRRAGEEITLVKRGTSTTVTLESESVRAANTSALALRAAWKQLVYEQWSADWSAWLDESITNGMLDAAADLVGTLDAECCCARVAEEYDYVRPVYVDPGEGGGIAGHTGNPSDEERGGLHIEGLRHPILERVHSSVPYVPHNLALGMFATKESTAAKSPNGILLYGVNAAGKSSLGKALGLAVLMAQVGMPVPASSMTLVPYRGLFTRILGNDNLWAGMSSFVVEMTEFRSILRSAGPRVLVIGDELCAGTETASATAIVAAGVQTLVERKAHFFFATHLHELATMEEIVGNPGIAMYHLTVHPDLATNTLVYDRLLRSGCGSPMYGLEVCRGLDMDATFLTRAFNYRKTLFGDDGARLSRYNASVVVARCEVCGSSDTLETHHIRPQADADKDGRVARGVHKNTASNLVSLCDTCHTKHHRGLLVIQGWVQTSAGRRLQWAPAEGAPAPAEH